MVNGIGEAIALFKFLEQLELTGSLDYSFSKEIMEYAVRYGGPNIVGYFTEDEEMDDLTPDELDIMNMADPTYKGWYEDKYIHDILLGSLEEDDESDG